MAENQNTQEQATPQAVDLDTKVRLFCPKCNLRFNESECLEKHFGNYVGTGENGCWEEWDDLVCPKCGTTCEYI